jgi:hypothetical protein
MRRPAAYFLLWGGLLGASAGLLWLWSFGLLDHSPQACTSATCVAEPYLPPALLTAAAAGCALTGLILVLTGRGGADLATRPAVEQSMTTVVLAIGIGIAVLGLAIGWWLIVIGAALALLGICGLIREQLALRRLRGSP